jgi:cardiolipin synthase
MSSQFTLFVSFAVSAIYVTALYSVALAIQRSRTPQGATAWSIALVSFPFLALPLFWVFGRSKFHGYVEAHRVVASKIRADIRHVQEGLENQRGEPPKAMASLCHLTYELTQLPFTDGNEAELLIDGEMTFTSILEAIRTAEEYVLIQFYIYRVDGIGNRIKEALLERARNGVRVYFLYDEIGSPRLSQQFKDELTGAGIEVSGFKTTKGRGNRFQVNFRNHRKIVVVDGRCAFIGGLNVGDDYLGLYPKVGPWRDTHVKITGPAALEAQISFVKDWYWPMDAIPALSWHPHVGDDRCQVSVVHTGPADSAAVATLYHIEAFNAARQRIWIANPYFVPDEPTERALQLAALRDVDVRIILPANNDNRIIQLAAMTYVSRLQRSGVRFYFYKQGEKGFLHQKTFLVDDQLSAVGTTNLDNRSLHINFECTALILDAKFARQVKQVFEDDFRESTSVDKDVFEDRSYWYKLAAKTANLGAPML